MKKEFVMLEESVSDTQKIIRQWMSTGYNIEIVSQILGHNIFGHNMIIVTALFKTK